MFQYAKRSKIKYALLSSFIILVIGAAYLVSGNYYRKLLNFFKARAIPFTEKATHSALAKPGSYYLAYVSRTVNLDLTDVSGLVDYEWYDPKTGNTVVSGQVQGGATRTFSLPRSGDFVLWVRAVNSVSTSHGL